MRIVCPRKELSPYVRYYWILKTDEPFSVLTFPIGCPQLIFHRKTPLYIPEIGCCQSQFTISGQVNFPAHIQSQGGVDMIVTVFYPHTAGMFTDTSPSAFYNLEISGYDIENRRLNEVAAKILDTPDDDGAVRELEQWLLARINPTLNLRRTGRSIEMLMRNPGMTVERLAREACLSRKQYERVFREQVGMNPKEYGRIVRFQKALWLLQRGSCNYAAMAADCVYADQSHFIREFKAFSGHTPNTLHRFCTPYSDLFANPLALA